MTTQMENEKAVLEVHQHKVDSEDIIVLKYDIENMPFDAIREFHLITTNTFPDNKVISLPNGSSLEVMTKEEISEVIESLTEYLNSDKSE